MTNDVKTTMTGNEPAKPTSSAHLSKKAAPRATRRGGDRKAVKNNETEFGAGQCSDLDFATEVFHRGLYDYLWHEIVPRQLAMFAREDGDSSVSPKDFACGCPISVDDLLPRCQGRRDPCHFAHRPDPSPDRVTDIIVKLRCLDLSRGNVMERLSEMSWAEFKELLAEIAPHTSMSYLEEMLASLEQPAEPAKESRKRSRRRGNASADGANGCTPAQRRWLNHIAGFTPWL